MNNHNHPASVQSIIKALAYKSSNNSGKQGDKEKSTANLINRQP